MKVEYICATCGSSHISRDAWADWDSATQQWVLGAVFDYVHCHRCEGETSLDERVINPDGKAAPANTQ